MNSKRENNIKSKAVAAGPAEVKKALKEAEKILKENVSGEKKTSNQKPRGEAPREKIIVGGAKSTNAGIGEEEKENDGGTGGRLLVTRTVVCYNCQQVGDGAFLS